MLDRAVIRKIGKRHWQRHHDSRRDDRTFLPMFQMRYRHYTSPKQFVYHQNPIQLIELDFDDKQIVSVTCSADIAFETWAKMYGHLVCCRGGAANVVFQFF